jgi:hypothetical protein
MRGRHHRDPGRRCGQHHRRDGVRQLHRRGRGQRQRPKPRRQRRHPLRGLDFVDAGDGDDTIFADWGSHFQIVGDVDVVCGSDNDTAFVDDVDTVSCDCENVFVIIAPGDASSRVRGSGLGGVRPVAPEPWKRLGLRVRDDLLRGLSRLPRRRPAEVRRPRPTRPAQLDLATYPLLEIHLCQ